MGEIGADWETERQTKKSGDSQCEGQREKKQETVRKSDKKV